MKTITRNFFPEILVNPINRNLILIFTTAAVSAIGLITAVLLLIESLQGN